MAVGHSQSRPSLTAALVLVGLSTFAVGLLALDARATYGARLTADEPQYLLTAISLGEDLDLDISDELAERRFQPFHELDLDPQTIALDPSGRRVSPHDPLLPAVLAAPTTIGGWMAAKATLALVAAITAATTLWLAVRRFHIDVATAALVTAAMFAAPPLTSYATQVYPEMPAALAVLVGVASLTGPRRLRSELAAAAAIVALPWLSVKYVPLSIVLTIGLVWPLLRSDRRRAALTTGALVAAAVVYVLVHRDVYGGWTVYAAGDHFVDGELLVVGREPNYPGRSRRLIGLLIDRNFGLVPWTPAYLALPPALAALAGGRVRGRGLVLAVVAAGWAVATWVALTMHGSWWPGRQIVVVLPLAVVAIAAFVQRSTTLRRIVVFGSALGTVSWLWLVVEASTGRRTLVVDFYETANPWYRGWSTLFPDHRHPAALDVALTALWLVVTLAAAAVAWRRAKRRARAEPSASTPVTPKPAPVAEPAP